MALDPDTSRTSSDDRVILSCVNRVRCRLWMMRLLERFAVALIAAGVIALPLVGAKVLWDRYLLAAVCLALIPAAGGLWLWLSQVRFNRIIAPPFFLKSTAVAAALLRSPRSAFVLRRLFITCRCGRFPRRALQRFSSLQRQPRDR